MKQSKFSDSQIVNIIKQTEDGVAVARFTENTTSAWPSFHKWRSKFSGIDVSLMARMCHLEKKMFD